MSDVETLMPPRRRRPPFAIGLRLGRILWRVLPWALSAGLLLAATWLLDASEPVRWQVGVVALAIAAYALVTAILSELLSPTRPELRVIPLGDLRAQQLKMALRLLLFVLVITEIASWLIRENGWRPSVAAILQIVRNVVLFLLLAAVIAWTGLLERVRRGTPGSYRSAIGFAVSRLLVPLALLTALFLAVVEGLGYQPLATFVGVNMIWTGLKILAAVLLLRYLRNGLQNAVTLGREADKPGEPSESEIGVERLVGGLLKLVVVAAALLWILWGWGLGPLEIAEGMGQGIFEDGGLTWGDFLGGVGSVATVLLLGWALKTVLTFFVFPRANVEVGARYAILAVLRYTVIAFAFVFGLKAFGLDTSSLGWFFGLAGIGLGFGLQDIIGNFFSGIILLLERPIRVGDVIKVGETGGTVEEIRMRGTVIRTFDKTSVMIPNRQMLGERVTHLTHGLDHTRIRIDVGVSYEADPEQVRSILQEIAEGHEAILADPAPFVWFDGYGESSLNFALLGFTAQVTARLGIASELRFEILRRFREASIEIPFPQRDIHIRTGGSEPAAAS